MTRDRHICTSCQRLLLAFDFPHNGSHPAGKGAGGKGGWVDSEGIRRRSECRTCKRERDNARYRGATFVPPDPEFASEVPEVIELLRSLPATVPSEPFAQWLETKYAVWRLAHNGGMPAFAMTLGISARQVERYVRRQQKTVKWSVVDQALTAEGSNGLWELYPELYPGDVEQAA